MNRGRAMFNEHPDGYFIPANKAAIAATAVMSNRFPRPKDMIEVRKLGYVPCLPNGQEIGGVDVRA